MSRCVQESPIEKKKNYVTSSGSQADVKSGINKTNTSEASFSVFFLCLLSVCLWLCLRVLLCVVVCCCCCYVSCCGCVCVRCVWCETLEKPTVCRFKTSPCVPAPRPHVETHVRVVPANTVLNVHTRCMREGEVVVSLAFSSRNKQK